MRPLANFIIFICFTINLQAQVTGFAYNFDGVNTYARLGEVLKDIETIEFWIKPNQNISSSGNIQPLLVRDVDGFNFIGNEEFALFFNTDGKLTFRVGNGTASAEIESDRNTWSQDVWYHIAVNINPSQGLFMYVNGVEQTDKNTLVNSVYFRAEGGTGDLYLGRWDLNENDYLNAELEEMRFWTSSRSLSQIRNTMCHTLLTGPKHIITFNIKSATSLSTLGSPLNPILVNGNTTDYKVSNAPMGESSTHLYTANFNGKSLGMSKLYDILINNITTTAQGVHIYNFIETKKPLGLLNRGQFGVWFTSESAKYNASFNYDNLSVGCDSCMTLSSRDYLSKNNWAPRSPSMTGCQVTLLNESAIGLNYREEYKLLDTLIIDPGVPDTAIFCSLDSKFIDPTPYPGAVYIWDDSIKTQSFLIQSSGVHHVDVYWKGCHARRTIYAKILPTPEFYLPKDTTICEGDTLWLTAPIDSADYIWIGFFTDREFGITAPGTYNLKITKNGCFYQDEIKVDMINDFKIDLGKDTTLCLGQEIDFAFNRNGINYLWNDGSTSAHKRIFNAPGEYWVKGYNSCFERTDTVIIDYEECECRIFVSNSFTPNGDGINDVYKAVSGCYYEEFQFEILNRWGDIIFSSSSLDQGWDGLINGKPAQVGMYNWRMRYKKFSWERLSNYEYGQLILSH